MDTITEQENQIYEIYIIKNVLNNKSYIGVAKKWVKLAKQKYYLYGGVGRFKRHISNALSTNNECANDCPDLYEAIREYTPELFICKILRTVNKNTKDYEKKYILRYKNHDSNF